MRTLTFRRPLVPISLAATALAALLVVFAWPQPAAAHDALVASDPAADSTVDTLPDELILTFNAALIGGEGTTAVEVLDADGNSVADGEPTVDGAVVSQPLTAEAAAGEYLVEWRVVSSDGHPTDGGFSFTVTTSTLAEPSAAPSVEPSAEPTTEPSAQETMPPTATSEPTATPAPDTQDSSPATGWIWAISIVSILVAAGIVAWLAIRSSRRTSSPDSDTPTER